MNPKPKTIDEYFATLNDEERHALEVVRGAILKAAPAAEEGWSYGAPAFRLGGRPLAGFVANKSYCSFYPMSSDMIEHLSKELKSYATSKGAIRFPATEPPPPALLQKLVRARMSELDRRLK